MSVNIIQIHKRDSYEYRHIQDKFSVNVSSNTYALSDGTTQSFKSEIWAQIITENFVNKPVFEKTELISEFKILVKNYSKQDYQFSSNPAIASIERAKKVMGGTATFIGVQIINNKEIRCISCGDSNLFLIKKNKINSSYPFLNLGELNNNNYFLNTEQLIQDKIEESFFSQTSIEVEKNDILILATDALSRFILKFPDKLPEILSLKSFDETLNFCSKYWESKELEEDDITALIINLDDRDEISQIVPAEGFSFPKEVEYIFVPESLQNLEIIFTDMESQEIRKQFNGIKNDFDQVKKKQKQNELLLMIAISLLFVNIFLTLYLKPLNDKRSKAPNQIINHNNRQVRK